MTGFQKLFAHMVADPDLCRRIKNEPGTLSQVAYDLTEKEKERIVHMAHQRGMGTNCMLYQINRFTPLLEYMPYTCKVLHDSVRQYAREYWDGYLKTNLQFRDEALLFARFMLQKIQNGDVSIPYLEDIVKLEITLNHIQFYVFDTPETPGVVAVHTAGLAGDARMVYMKHDLRTLVARVAGQPPGTDCSSIAHTHKHHLVKLTEGTLETEPLEDDLAQAILANDTEKLRFMPQYLPFLSDSVIR